jgi:LysR family transcriptional regulator, hydrogen peroxide-inducible genes activator
VISTHPAFRNKREDWIPTMVAAGMGVCFLPECFNAITGVISRPVIAPLNRASGLPGHRRRFRRS